MYKVEITYNGDTWTETDFETDEPLLFDSYDEAVEHALDMLGACATGSEVLNLSNPFENEAYEDQDHDDDGFEIIEV